MNPMFYAVFMFGMPLIASPGPDFIVITSQSLRYSWKTGLATTLGVVVGNIMWVTLTIACISVVAKAFLFFTILKWVCVVYLAYIGVRLLRSKGVTLDESGQNAVSETLPFWKGFRAGFVVNAMNVKCIGVLLSLFGLVIDPNAATSQQFACGAEFVGLVALWYCGVVAFFQIPWLRQLYTLYSKWVDRGAGGWLIWRSGKMALSDSGLSA